jgi:N-acetylmuramoyl-L-alanine amidase
LNLRLHRLFTTLPFLFALIAGAPGVITQAQPPAPLTMLSREGRRVIPLTLVNNQEFVAMDDLASVFQLTVREDALGALTVTYRDKTIVLTNQALASVAGRLVSLPAPAARGAGGRWLVPVEFISRALGLVYDSRLELRKPSHLLIVGDLRVPRITVRYDLVSPGSRLTVDATPRANSTVTQENNNLLSIKFDADALDVDVPPLAPQGPQSLIQTVRVIDATTLGVELGPRVAGFRATSLPVDTTMRLTIDVLAAAADGTPAAPGVAAAPSVPDLPPLGPPATAIQTIALDPGHGGADEGVTGAGGTKEKNLTLAIARRIKAAIEARLGIRVLLTRDDDRQVPLEDRTAVANNNKADLFISLHVNGSLRPEAGGATIYYAAFEASAVSTAFARVESVPTFSGAIREIELVNWDLAQTHHLDQSMAFAAMLEERLRDQVPLTAQAIDRAPLAVLESANMPALLIEMGFLTNPDQEKQLTGGAFQNAFVQALIDTIIRFRDSLPGEGQ